ncbi:MAG: hypothetical protein KF795_00605 [Labilithrix sp.]|nr:hypothetical protein [Labilithrix sp.]
MSIYHPRQESPTLEYGSIGWEDVPDYIFPGTDDNDGHTLVRVQLFRGRDVTKPLSSTRAQGIQLVAHINSLGGFRTPPHGTRCLVAIPAGMEQIPGAAMIMGIVEKSSERFDTLPNGSVAMSAGQGQARVITNNDGSITLFSTDDNTANGKSVYVRVAPDAIQFVAPWGTIRWDASGFHLLHSSGASIDLGGIYGLPAPLDALTSYVKLQAASIIGTAVTQTFGTGLDTPDSLVGKERATVVLEALQDEISKISISLVALRVAMTAMLTEYAAQVGFNGPGVAAGMGIAKLAAAWELPTDGAGELLLSQATNVGEKAVTISIALPNLGTSTNSN